MSASLADALHRIGHRQLGLVTTAQLRSIGVPERTQRNWVAQGRLRPIERGVLLVSGAPVSWPVTMLAACLASGGLASHRSAGVLYGLPGFRAGRRELTVPWQRRWSGDARLHRSRHFDAINRRVLQGVPVVDPLQLALDLASLTGRGISSDRLDDAVDHLIRGGQLSATDLEAVAARARERRITGCAELRSLISEYLDDDTDSRLEREYVSVLVGAGIPRPVQQHEIFDDTGTFIARVDHAWPVQKVASEVDSLRHHLNRDAFEADREKRNRLRAHDWLVHEVTSRMIRKRPETLVAVTKETLQRRANLGR